MSKVLRLQHTSIPMPADGREAARQFFGEALGMIEVTPPSSLEVDKLVWFKAGPDGHEVHVFTDEDVSQRSSAQHLCLEVDDVQAYRDRLSGHGIKIEE